MNNQTIEVSTSDLENIVLHYLENEKKHYYESNEPKEHIYIYLLNMAVALRNQNNNAMYSGISN